MVGQVYIYSSIGVKPLNELCYLEITYGKESQPAYIDDQKELNFDYELIPAIYESTVQNAIDGIVYVS